MVTFGDCWPSPVDAPNPLLDLHGVPRQIVVDDYACKLQIDPFTRHLGRQQHTGSSGFSKPINDCLLVEADTTCERNAVDPLSYQSLAQVIECGSEVGKENNLLLRGLCQVTPELAAQGYVLRIICSQFIVVAELVSAPDELPHEWSERFRLDVVDPEILIRSLSVG